MIATDKYNQRVAEMSFALVYPLYLKKVEAKGKTKKDLNLIITWLTGFDEPKINELIKLNVNFKQFFNQATLNPKASLITGVICGYKIEEIENSLTKKVRYLDKLVDELAKGKKLDKILRK